MKRISLVLASLALLFSTKASAFVGGPFDNGDFNVLLDNTGVYQASFRFSNGSGFAQFGNNVDTSLFVDANAGGTQALGSTYSIWNRALIYYKGVTYLGTCYGMVDHQRKIVQGVTNGNSDVSTTAVTGAGVGATGGSAITAATTSLNNNGNAGLPCNTEFRCRITATHPVLRFDGGGELTVLNSNIGTVVFNAISAIVLAGAQQPDSIDVETSGDIDVNDFTLTVGEQISDLLTAVTANQAGINAVTPSAALLKANSESVKMHVFGSRIFFNSRR